MRQIYFKLGHCYNKDKQLCDEAVQSLSALFSNKSEVLIRTLLTDVFGLLSGIVRTFISTISHLQTTFYMHFPILRVIQIIHYHKLTDFVVLSTCYSYIILNCNQF